MINTLNETDLHRAIKTLYLVQEEGSKPEAAVRQYIADILRPDGSIVEVQTGSLAHLKPKLTAYMEEKRRVKVVYPLVKEKYIETLKADGKITRKKSPKKQNLYSAFGELTALAPLLANRLLTIDILEVTVTEERKITDEPVQTTNQRRRWKKNWLKTGKRLDSICTSRSFCGKKDWLTLLPKGIRQFTVDECLALLREKEPRLTRNEVSLMLWVFLHAGFLSREKAGRAYQYQRKGGRVKS